MNPALIMNQSTRGPAVSHPDPQFDPADREMELSGVFYSMPEGAYRSAPGLSFTGVKHLGNGKAHYRYAMDNPIEPTEPMIIGRQVHYALENPNSINDRLVSIPSALVGVNKNTKEFQTFKKGVVAEGREILREGVLECVEAVMRKQLRMPGGPLVPMPEFLLACRKEVSAFWRNKKFDVACKGRADLLHNTGIIADWKVTSKPVEKRQYERRMHDDEHNVQGAWYLDGFTAAGGLDKPLEHFLNINIHFVAPYRVTAFFVDEASLDRARVDIDPRMALYLEAVKSGDWSDDVVAVESASLPTWAFPEDEYDFMGNKRD